MDKQKKLRELGKASEREDEDRVNRILEELEDYYHVDLTSFYGEDFNSKKIRELARRLR